MDKMHCFRHNRSCCFPLSRSSVIEKKGFVIDKTGRLEAVEMVCIVLLIVAVTAGGYFAFRYLSLIHAIKKVTKRFKRYTAGPHPESNFALTASKHTFKKLLCAMNGTLNKIQSERKEYAAREKAFQRQIENISHDLRTPLTVILGYLKIFKKSAGEQISQNKELSETINIVEHKAEIMNHLVTQFYDYSRLKACDYELRLGRVDAARTLRESLMGNYQILEQARLEINTDIPDHPVWVLGEEASLERIFFNLFQNAGRYADVYLSISIKECSNRIVITFVNDTQLLSEDDIPICLNDSICRTIPAAGAGLV